MIKISTLATIQKNIEQYIENRLELAKMDLVTYISACISQLLVGFLIVIHILLFLFFSSVSIALIIGEWTGSYALGSVIVSAFLACMLLIVWINRKRWFRKSVLRACIQSFSAKSIDKNEKGSN
jgi:hypothetical protein